MDMYDPTVEKCGACIVRAGEYEDDTDMTKLAMEDLQRENAATLMLYFNFCNGRLSNIVITVGGVWDWYAPRRDLSQ